MTVPIDRYPSRPITEIKEKPIAVATFKEPVFKLGEFQDCYIEVNVKVYPVSFEDSNGRTLVGVRFGEMNLIRFIDRDLLFDVRPFE